MSQENVQIVRLAHNYCVSVGGGIPSCGRGAESVAITRIR